jgi:hypothetical protein
MMRIWDWLRAHKRPRTTPVEESAEALKRAEGARDNANAQWPRVREVTISLAVLRERNHFAEGFRKTL